MYYINLIDLIFGLVIGASVLGTIWYKVNKDVFGHGGMNNLLSANANGFPMFAPADDTIEIEPISSSAVDTVSDATFFELESTEQITPVLEPLGQSRVIRLGRRGKGPMYLIEAFMVDSEEVVTRTQIDQMGFPLKGIKPTWYVGSLEEVVKHLFA